MSDLDGATAKGEDNAYPATPGEFAARWNAWTEARRADWLRRRIQNDQTAMVCFEADHDGEIERLIAPAVRRVAPDRETLIEFFTRCTIQAKAVDGVVSVSAESVADALLASGVLGVPADPPVDELARLLTTHRQKRSFGSEAAFMRALAEDVLAALAEYRKAARA